MAQAMALAMAQVQAKTSATTSAQASRTTEWRARKRNAEVAAAGRGKRKEYSCRVCGLPVASEGHSQFRGQRYCPNAPGQMIAVIGTANTTDPIPWFGRVVATKPLKVRWYDIDNDDNKYHVERDSDGKPLKDQEIAPKKVLTAVTFDADVSLPQEEHIRVFSMLPSKMTKEEEISGQIPATSPRNTQKGACKAKPKFFSETGDRAEARRNSIQIRNARYLANKNDRPEGYRGRKVDLRELFQSIQTKGNRPDVLEQRAETTGLKFRTPTPRDGNCFFWAVSDQLQREELKQEGADQMTQEDIRKSVTSYIRDHPDAAYGEPLASFIPTPGVSLEEYLSNMSEDGAWADHIYVQATADFLGRPVSIVSTSGNDDNCFIFVEPRGGGSNRTSLLLGHYAENHYQSLDTTGAAFTTTGFDNYKKGIEKFDIHDGKDEEQKWQKRWKRTDGVPARPTRLTLEPSLPQLTLVAS
ncbi:Hypp6624 [Branchiostoma lanceolatum]|uniref:Hypp6624 protein n=1 Tax=Branchiostoma lanceolatum TaxID=7740 RepID=A0A8J9YV92_BRALA|nr:Hypp6624 [Branchiostoma lanceolatum]